MQVPPLDAAPSSAIATVASTVARVVKGNLAAIPAGVLLPATVAQVSSQGVVLSVNGQSYSIRPSGGLVPGEVILVRVPAGGAAATNPMMELVAPPAAAPVQASPAESSSPAGSAVSAGVGRSATSAAALTTQLATAQPAAAQAKAQPAPAPGTGATPRPVLVDVLNAQPGGQFRVSIEGKEQNATSAQPLVPGQRYVLQAEQTSTGLALKPPADSEKIATDVATAVLRTPAPTFAETIQPLRAELQTLTAPQSGSGASPVPTDVRNAASAVQEVLNAIVPSDSRPLNATELQQLVENGGVHFEAKLARLLAEPSTGPQAQVQALVNPAPTAKQQPEVAAPTQQKAAAETIAAEAPTGVADTAKAAQADKTAAAAKPDTVESSAPAGATTHSTTELAPDLKGSLLRLLQSVKELGGAFTPAAQAAVHGIESQQASNSLSQANNAPYFVQVPFPDAGVWRTLQLALEPQRPPNQADAGQAGRFRLFMHVPLGQLGETWIDAGVSGDKLRATIYLEKPAGQDRVRAALPDLKTELQTDGFSEVLLSVRPSSEMPEARQQEAGALQAGRPDTVSVLDVKV